MKSSDIPAIVGDDFLYWFAQIHDEEEEDAAPGAEPCEDDSDCFVKIGDERMWELYEQFLSEQPWEVRQAVAAMEESVS